MVDSTKIFGAENLKAKFLELRQDMANKTSLRMTASGANELKKEARVLALGHGFKKSGALIRNISIKRETGTPPGIAQYHLGVRHGNDLTKKSREKSKLVYRKARIRYADDPYYWSFLEFGWIPRGPGEALRGGTTKKRAIRSAQAGRRIPGRSFIAQALKNKQQQAITAMQDRLDKDLSKHK